MNARTMSLTFSLMVAVVVATVSSATADAPKRFHQPDRNSRLIPHPNLPQFGFSSFNIRGYGERVTHVRRGSLASRVGLEPGDDILTLNGHRLSYPGSWNDALFHAVSTSGFVKLKVRDVRTGRIAHRQVFLGEFNGGIGPITPKFQKNRGDANHNFPTPAANGFPKFNQKVTQRFE